MAKRKNETKGVFCLENDWWGVKDKTTVEPLLHLLQTLGTYRVPYVHRDIGTRAEFDFYLKKWCGRSFASHPILYLAFHGSRGCLTVGQGRGKQLKLIELAGKLEGRCSGRVIHFGSCSTLDANGNTLNAFLRRTDALAVFGFRRDVDWLDSAAFDLLVLGYLQSVPFTVAGMRNFRIQLQESAYPDFAKRCSSACGRRQPEVTTWCEQGESSVEYTQISCIFGEKT